MWEDHQHSLFFILCIFLISSWFFVFQVEDGIDLSGLPNNVKNKFSTCKRIQFLVEFAALKLILSAEW